jgi:tryptophan-rich sensory protein
VLSCLAISAWLVVCKAEKNLQYAFFALMLYGAQCVLNVGWSLLFFTMQRPDIALWELVALDASLLGMVWTYGRISRLAALLLLPYLGWLILSTAINVWIVINTGAA